MLTECFGFSYKRLFKLMIDKDLKKKGLIRMTGISYSTIRKLENGENMNVEVLEKNCGLYTALLMKSLNCSLLSVGRKNAQTFQ